MYLYLAVTCKTNDVWDIIWLNIDTCRIGALTDSSVSMWQSWVTVFAVVLILHVCMDWKIRPPSCQEVRLFADCFCLFIFLYLKCVNTLTLFSSDNWVILFFSVTMLSSKKTIAKFFIVIRHDQNPILSFQISIYC